MKPRLFQKIWITYRTRIDGIYLPYKEFPFIGLFRKPKELPERGVANFGTITIKKGFKILQIGGGDGFTSINTLKLLNDSGYLSIYEGGEESIKRMTHNLGLHGFLGSTNYDIIHSIVGDSILVYGLPSIGVEIIDPLTLPRCDYLELDCEGSEKSILEKMIIRPNYIVAEIHPHLIGAGCEWLFSWVESNLYSITYLSGHDGKLISINEFRELYEFNLITGKKQKHSITGRAPMVVGLKKINHNNTN